MEAAKDAGVEHLVLLSGRGGHHARLGEDVVRNSGIDFTLVRAARFAQNFSEGYLRDPILAGVLPTPGGDMPEPIVDIDDIAVAALTEPGHKGELHEVTGPRLMTFADMADALGRPSAAPSGTFPSASRKSTPTSRNPAATSSRMCSPPSRARRRTAATPARRTA